MQTSQNHIYIFESTRLAEADFQSLFHLYIETYGIFVDLFDKCHSDMIILTSILMGLPSVGDLAVY